MKNCVIDTPADTVMDVCCLPGNNLLEGNYFATVPMIAVRSTPARNNQNEEDLYTSFEEAISERAARVSHQLSSLSLPAHRVPINAPTLVFQAPARNARWRRFWQARRRAISLACLGLSLLMAGFDLMGLLIIAR